MITGLCPHCLVGMYPDADAGRLLWYCGDCGYETPRRAVARKKADAVMETSRDRLNGGSVTAVVGTGNGTADVRWDKAARKRLDVLIAAIGEVDTFKREAEAIHQALTVMGAADLPSLPWQSGSTAKADSQKTLRVQTGIRRRELAFHERAIYRTPACVECGYQFSHATESTITRQGSICRSVRLCNERKGAA